MIWGAYTVQKTLNETILPQIASGKSRRILGFNEPDNRQQSNIPVERALEHWAQLEAANVPLISPSCVHANGAWMQAFMKNATETCKRVDWIGVHWYGGPNFETFQRYLLETFALYNNRPLLITEFACADFGAETLEDHSHTQSSVLSFMKQALPWLEAQEWIAGYVWFSFNISQPFGTASALFNEGGELTALGRYYSSVRTDTPMGNQSIQAGPWQ